MSRVVISSPTVANFNLAALKMKRCLEEFLRTSRRPKDLLPMDCAAFEALLAPAIWHAGPEKVKPWSRDAPKQVRDHPPHWGAGMLSIAIKVLTAAGMPVDTFEHIATSLRKYRRILRRLKGMSQVKERDRAELEHLQTFIVALSRLAIAAADARRVRPDDDDDD
jgi:hypothetical protein